MNTREICMASNVQFAIFAADTGIVMEMINAGTYVNDPHSDTLEVMIAKTMNNMHAALTYLNERK